jgi:hypothetical protein
MKLEQLLFFDRCHEAVKKKLLRNAEQDRRVWGTNASRGLLDIWNAFVLQSSLQSANMIPIWLHQLLKSPLVDRESWQYWQNFGLIIDSFIQRSNTIIYFFALECSQYWEKDALMLSLNMSFSLEIHKWPGSAGAGPSRFSLIENRTSENQGPSNENDYCLTNLNISAADPGSIGVLGTAIQANRSVKPNADHMIRSHRKSQTCSWPKRRLNSWQEVIFTASFKCAEDLSSGAPHLPSVTPRGRKNPRK